MPSWRLTCPNCGHETDAPAPITVRCGRVECSCTCPNCSHEYDAEIEWWRWAGLDEPPPDEPAQFQELA